MNDPIAANTFRPPEADRYCERLILARTSEAFLPAIDLRAAVHILILNEKPLSSLEPFWGAKFGKQ